MINDVVVIDNVIPRNYQDDIERHILDKDFPWYYVPNVSRKTEGEARLAADSVGFAHSFVEPKKGSISFVTQNLLPLMNQSCAKINVTPKTVFLGRVFMTVATGKPIRNLFHTDMRIPHLVCLYYINDSTGPTVLLSRTSDDVDADEINLHDQSKYVTHEVEPRKGRVVLFDGKFYHASTSPDSGRRCIINFDIGT